MKKLLLVAVVALGLGGCATIDAIGNGLSLATKSIANPVTKTNEAQIELAIDAAIVALKGYKQACVAGTADKPCRDNIAAIQAYTRQMPPLIAQLRSFVDNNDQINAAVAYNQLAALYSNFKTTATNLGYNVGNLP